MKLRSIPSKLTDEQRQKLPKYVQEYIRDTERRRADAEKKLAAYLDNQTESNIYFTDRDGNKVYLSQEATERLTIKSQCGKIHLYVKNYHDDKIQLSWTGGEDEYGIGDVALIPTGYQQARLVHPENMHVR